MISKSLLVTQNLSYLPRNYMQALEDARFFAADELLSGQLQVEAWTDRGVHDLILRNNELIVVGVRVNRPCFIQLLYSLADGRRTLLLNNFFIDQSKVNHALILPDTFEVCEPFGVEQLHVFASTERFPPVKIMETDGYDILEDSLEMHTIRVRGLKKLERTAPELAETHLVITTTAH